MAGATKAGAEERVVRIQVGGVELEGNLGLPVESQGMVLFAHGSGSSRHSPRNRYVARVLRDLNLGTLLMDLLTTEEEIAEAQTRHLRFNIGLLAERLVGATNWLAAEPVTAELSVGYFGASTGGGAALVAAAMAPDRVGAVVLRGGRPDLAGTALSLVRTPTLLLVGGLDTSVLELNREAYDQLSAPEKQLIVVPGATHLFEEPGTLEQVARLASDWFLKYLPRPARALGTEA